MPQLVLPTARMYTAWQDAHAEWGPGFHEDGFGLQPADDVASRDGFDAWIRRVSDDSHCTYRWIVEGEQVLGGIALRHGYNDNIQRNGHIGYGIRPSARGRGLASWALGQMVAEARLLGMDRLLVVCEADNVASARSIQSQGGILEDTQGSQVTLGKAIARYWITLQHTNARNANTL